MIEMSNLLWTLTKFIRGPKTSMGHRVVGLETNPESISGGQNGCWQGVSTILSDEGGSLAGSVSNLRMKLNPL